MNLILIRLFLILGRATLLIISSSLPIQALALLILRGATAIIVACKVSILLGIYTILIYARGLLVLLAYFVALSPNQNLNTPRRVTFLSSFLFIILILLQIWPNSSFFHLSPITDHSRNVITIITPHSSALLAIIALILVLTIIAVVKVSRIRSGPVRPWRRN